MPSRPRRKKHTRSKTSDEESNIGLIHTHSARPNGLSRATTSATNDIPIIKNPKIAKKKILCWRSGIIVLWFVSACLLYLLTDSHPLWRNSWSVVKVHLPGGEWGAIESRGRGISGNVLHLPTKRDDRYKRQEAEGKGDEEEGEETDGGWLSVNMWGWCLQDVSKTEIICSGEDMLFDLNELLGEESRSSAPSGEDFNFILTHGLIIHGLAMVTAMMAVIPMIITTFRSIRAKQPTIQGGWFEHGLLLAACVLCLIAYIIDRLLKTSVKNNLENHKVLSGQALTVNGICTLFLFLTFLLSALPPFYFHMKRQSQLVRYWEDLEDFDEALADDDEEKSVRKKRPRRVKRSRTIRAARALFGRRDDGERGERREGTISRWRSRRRRRRDDRTRDERRERYDTRHGRRRRRHRDS
ncbi:hypothetical protein I302_100579 [Kwoniella bestiolae CBS 10118]|uniref:Uncharacterized protein n=1 Tax=Kwoniella bestiolae CBS 10118 TaxID=1296100 RepID=A0A1B9G5J5_9TREE|nr:hypothetical protein I302_03954 [Kwoniella bestiolae CBS 10118]OCF26272.1 hypothetical protein I302_03954 [Kwoniella bestiolae CBS 10118]